MARQILLACTAIVVIATLEGDLLGQRASTSRIAGVVMSDDPQQGPVRRAVVTAEAADPRTSQSLSTDETGRFEFQNMPAGSYTLVAERPGYITSAWGSKRPGRLGVAVAVDGKSDAVNLRIQLWRGAVIEGQVEDEHGAPLREIAVRAVQKRRAVTSTWESLSNNGMKTDDLGHFRIFGLEPGEYIIVALPPAMESSSLSTPSVAQIDALLDALKRRQSIGDGQGAQTALPVSAAEDAAVYVATYYPEQASADRASPVVVVAGEQVTGIRMVMRRVRTGSVSGTVTDPTGAPVSGASVSLIPPQATASYPGLPTGRRSVTTDAGGRFSFTQVLPGTYYLLGRLSASARPISAMTAVSVSGGSGQMTNLQFGEGSTVQGRAVFERSVSAGSGSAGVAQCRIVLSSELDFQVAAVQADGTFAITGLLPGGYQLRPAGSCSAPNWWPISARLGDVDLLDERQTLPLEGSLIIRFADRPSALVGRLQVPGGAAVSDVFVIAFTTQRGLWRTGARRVQAVRPSVDGAFSISGLPDGSYHLAVVTDADPDDWSDPQFLESILPQAVVVTIHQGKTTTQNLEIRR